MPNKDKFDQLDLCNGKKQTSGGIVGRVIGLWTQNQSKTLQLFQKKMSKAICKEFKPEFFIQIHHHISPIPLDNTIKTMTKETIYWSIIETLKLLERQTQICCPDPLSRKDLLALVQFLPGAFKPPCRRSHPSWSSLIKQGQGTTDSSFQPISGCSDAMFTPKFLTGLAKVLLDQNCSLATSSAPSCFLSFFFTLINILHPKLLNICFQRTQSMIITFGRILEVLSQTFHSAAIFHRASKHHCHSLV